MQPCRLAIGYSLTDEESMYMKGENTCLASDMDLEAEYSINALTFSFFFCETRGTIKVYKQKIYMQKNI